MLEVAFLSEGQYKNLSSDYENLSSDFLSQEWCNDVEGNLLNLGILGQGVLVDFAILKTSGT